MTRRKAPAFRVVLEHGAQEQDWQQARLAGIGGSEIGTILGRSKFGTPLDLYTVKVLGTAVEVNEAMEVGSLLEPALLQVAIYKLNEESEGGTWELESDTPALVQSVEHPVALYSPDGVAVAGNGRRILLETKATNFNMDVIPDSYHDQVRWGLGVLGLDVGYLVAVNGTRVYTHRVDADPEWFAKAAQFAAEWYETHVEQEVLPEADPVRDQALLASMRSPVDNLRHEVSDPTKIVAIRNLKAEIKRLEEELDLVMGEVKMEMGDATVLTVGDEQVATYKRSFRTTLDAKRLKAEQPDLYLAYSRKSPTHTFLLTKPKGK